MLQRANDVTVAAEVDERHHFRAARDYGISRKAHQTSGEAVRETVSHLQFARRQGDRVPAGGQGPAEAVEEVTGTQCVSITSQCADGIAVDVIPRPLY